MRDEVKLWDVGKERKLFYRTEEQIQRFFFSVDVCGQVDRCLCQPEKTVVEKFVILSFGSQSLDIRRTEQAKVALFLRLMDIGRSPPRRHLSMEEEAKRVALAGGRRRDV